MNSPAPTVLLVDASASDRTLIILLLERELPDVVIRSAATAVEFAELLGQDRVDALVCDSALPWADAEEVAAAVRRRHPRCVLVLTGAHGDEAFVRMTMGTRSDACLIKDSEGILALPRVLMDVLRRRNVEAVDGSSPGFDRHVIDGLPLGVVLLNVRGRITHANPAACTVLGTPAESLLGKDVLHCIDDPGLRSLWDRRNNVDAAVEEPIEIGGARLKASLRGLKDDQGALAGHELIVKQAHTGAELALGRQAERLRRANEELEQLTYALSHDLQEPLQLIARHVHRLVDRQRDRLDEDGQRAIGHVARSVERMQNMLDSILTYSRIGAHDGPLDEVDLDRLLDEAIIDLGSLVEETGADLTHGQLPTLRVSNREMTQLFHNLLTNAIKFRRDEPPKIDIRVEEREREWLFAVADNGIGIDAADADRIFGMFQRLHTEEEYPGTGVGLALCKRIVERHGGRIWMRSETGRGTTFYFTIPKRSGSEQAIGATPHGEQRARE
jgi:signal transduction histidine kinase